MLRALLFLLANLVALLTGIGLLARFIPPAILWPPTVVALMLPWLLLFTLLSFSLLLYRGYRRAAILPGLVLLFSLTSLGRVFSFGGGAPAAKESITLLTCNLMTFKDQNWQPVDPARVTKTLKNQQADVLMFQEAGHSEKKARYPAAIRAAGDYGARLHPSRKTLATYASNLKAVGSEFTTYNGFSVADVTTKLGPLRIINAHLESNRISRMASEIGKDKELKQELYRAESMFRSYGRTARIRAEQAEKIRRYIDESPYPVVVGGDFNDVPSSYTYQRILSPRLQDAWVEAGFGLGATFTGPLPGLRIDFLMVDTSLQVQRVERFDTGWSDHLGMTAVVSKR